MKLPDMGLAAALIYWVVIALWLAVLGTLCVAYARNPKIFGATRLLIAVLLIDTARNLAENFYFGLYFGGQYGLLPASFAGVLGNPAYLILPKIANVVAASVVLGVLTLWWLPRASRERAAIQADLDGRSAALGQESEERKRLFETSLDLILITDRRGVFVRVSPSSLAAVGYLPEEMLGRTGAEFIYPEDLDRTRAEMRLARRGREMRNFGCRYVHKDGHAVPLAWSGVWSEPEQRHYFIGRDMSEQRAAEERLRQLALFDPLTGLPNRASLQEDLGSHFEASELEPVAVAIFDLDGFKDINDTLGHSVGDKLLDAVAKRIREADREAGAYRMGGDEFALVLRDCADTAEISARTQAVLKKLTERFQIDGHSLFISASAGIAIAPSDGRSVDELLSNAELALYDAKAAGGRTSRSFVPALRARAQSRRQLDVELRRACANSEFELHFQPQLSAADDSVVGAEALLRWRHPERGLLSPGSFIEALAESAVAGEVGNWILTTACQAAAQWRRDHATELRIAVNLFPAQFRGGTLVADVERALAQSGLPAEALELEITENVALDRDDTVLAPLQALREKGIGLAFDDFGTGYASLSYLTRYPLTRIKIDRSFVQRIAEGARPEDTAIVRSIIAMATNLGLEVTAEGVETPAQARFLRAQDCHDLQGFLFSKPLPADEFEAFLAASGEQQKRRFASGT